MILPNSVLALIGEIKEMNNVRVSCDKGEVLINAPDPGEDGEQEALDKLTELKKELENCNDLKIDAFSRDCKIDALRIYSS